MDRALRRIEMGLGLDHVQRRLQRLGTRRPGGRLEEAPRQPTAEAFSSDWPGLAMAVDVEIGEAGSVGRMKKFGGLGEFNQDVGLLWSTPAKIPAFLSDGLVERCDAAARLLELRTQRLEGSAVVRLQPS
jgi:hypothetical protein